VVSRQTHLIPGSDTFTAGTDEQLGWMQTRAAEGRLYGTVLGGLSDGTLVLLDGRFDSAASEA
jgi:hypothetical protein